MTAGTISKKALLALMMAFFAIGSIGCSSSEESSTPPTETQEGGGEGGNPDHEVGGLDDYCDPEAQPGVDLDCVGG